MVKLSGGVAKVRAHGVDHVLGDLPKLDFSPVKQAFVSIPEKKIEAHHGLVKLLVGLDHLYLHPVEVERTGSLALHVSMFGIKTGWIISGNLAAAARNTAWAGAIRNYHYVPLDFLSAEALGTEPLRRCSACMKCKECQFRASVLTFKENAEYEAIVNNLSYSKELKKWTASYPFIEDPGVLQDNKGQALACMKSLEHRLKKQERLEQFNQVFQEIVDRGVFRELSKEEMDNWEGPVNYISMVEAFKEGTTPIRICMNSSMKQPSPVRKSLNDILMKGPPALADLFTVTVGFREHKFALTKDL
jgi:hypothetical protein